MAFDWGSGIRSRQYGLMMGERMATQGKRWGTPFFLSLCLFVYFCLSLCLPVSLCLCLSLCLSVLSSVSLCLCLCLGLCSLCAVSLSIYIYTYIPQHCAPWWR